MVEALVKAIETKTVQRLAEDPAVIELKDTESVEKDYQTVMLYLKGANTLASINKVPIKSQNNLYMHV